MNCYILIGGRSSRMGRSKVSLFLDRVTRAASPVFDRVYAVQRHGEAAAPIETVFEESHDDTAPVFGVLRAIEHAADSCFILGVDYPLVTAEVLRYIAQRFESTRAPLVAPRWNGRVQMLCAAYGKENGAILARRIAEGRLDLRGIADSGEIIDEAEMRARFSGEPLMNVNTPEEFEEAQRLS